MKPTITRLPEFARAKTTEAGKQLVEVIDFLSAWGEQGLRALRNSLTFEDNFDCAIKTAQLRSGVSISLGPATRQISEVRIRKVVSTVYGVASFLWSIDTPGNLVVTAGFVQSTRAVVSATASTTTITVTSTNHGLSNGLPIYVYGASGFTTSANALGIYPITVISANSFSYVVTTTPTGSGIISYSAQQPATPSAQIECELIVYYR